MLRRLETTAAAILARAGIPVDRTDDAGEWKISVGGVTLYLSAEPEVILPAGQKQTIGYRARPARTGKIIIPAPMILGADGGFDFLDPSHLNGRFNTEARLIEHVLSRVMAALSHEWHRAYYRRRTKLAAIRTMRANRFGGDIDTTPPQVLEWSDITTACQNRHPRCLVVLDEYIEREQLAYWSDLKASHVPEQPAAF
jgi:hypothetical protein